MLDIALPAGVITSSLLGTIYLWVSLPFALVHFFTGGVLLLLAVVHRRTAATVVCGRIASAYLFFFMAITSWYLGALQNASMGWFVVVPISAAIIIGSRDAWFWVAVSIVCGIGFFSARQFGFEATNFVDPALRSITNLSFFSALMLVVGILITTWLASQRLLEAQLNESLNETEEEALNAKVLASTSTAANEGAVFDTTAQDCMNILCETHGWGTAQLWIKNDDGSVMPTRISATNQDDELAFLLSSAGEVMNTDGTFLPQLVAQSGVEIVQNSLNPDPRFVDAEMAGVQTALVWPVFIDGEVDAVLEFFSRERLLVDERQRQQLRHVALQLAHVRGREVAHGRIEQLAYFDIVTGLPNRHAFERRFSNIIESAERRSTRVALMFIDLDGFKHVNDSLGHAAGDKLLHVIGQKLSENLRGSDFAMKLNPPGASMVARLGGDEFTVVLQDLKETRGAEVVARRFLDIVAKPIDVDGQEVVVGASIGISVYPDDSTNRSDLLRLADAAMYEAKRADGHQFRFATAQLNASIQQRVRLENQLRHAVNSETLVVAYQPIIDANSEEIIAFEALARWRDKGRWIEPSTFVPLAEETGLIHKLGRTVLRRACQEITAYNAHCEIPVRVTVNVSPHQLRQEQFVSVITDILEETGCSAHWLAIELTETSLIIDEPASIELLGKLRELGVGVALDDFGTGYASLSHLRKFPLDFVKIDRAFISTEDDTAEDDAIIAAITSLSHTLKLKVIAEGVETEAQARRIRALGCDALQGHWYGKADVLPDLVVPPVALVGVPTAR